MALRGFLYATTVNSEREARLCSYKNTPRVNVGAVNFVTDVRTASSKRNSLSVDLFVVDTLNLTNSLISKAKIGN